MWPSRLYWNLLPIVAGPVLVLGIGVHFAIASWHQRALSEQIEPRLRDAAVILRSQVADEAAASMADPGGDPSEVKAKLRVVVSNLSGSLDGRLTVLDGEGNVLADSSRPAEGMLNHNNREELVEARTEGQGVAIRRSPTLGIQMYYFALPVMVEGKIAAFVRVATDLEETQQRFASLLRLVWLLGAIVFAAGAGVVYLVANRIVQPIKQLTDRADSLAAGSGGGLLTVDNRDELGELVAAFNQMQAQVADRVADLTNSNERLGTVLGSMDEGIIAVDSEERIQLANSASRKLLAVVTGDPIGRHLLEASRSRPLHDTVRECLAMGRSTQAEFEASGKHRRTLTVRATCLPGDPCPGAVVWLHDSTDLRRLENLRQEFVANVSHELKTPLAAIKAYAETLRLGAVNDAEHNLEFVARIEEQANRLHDLILDLLQIARIETGREVFEITEVAVRRVVDACIAEYRGVADRKQIALEVDPSPHPLSVRADEQGLRSIVNNLVDNAIKYTPEGGQVTIRWHSAGEHALLEVQDTGIGISAEDQSRVFERFYRADKARSREMGGTGLGLSIVKHLSQAFGGSVELQSRLGKGSTFQVTLPVSQQP